MAKKVGQDLDVTGSVESSEDLELGAAKDFVKDKKETLIDRKLDSDKHKIDKKGEISIRNISRSTIGISFDKKHQIRLEPNDSVKISGVYSEDERLLNLVKNNFVVIERF